MRSIECPLFTPIEVFYITTKGNFYHNSHDFQNFLADEVESDNGMGINNSWKHPPVQAAVQAAGNFYFKNYVNVGNVDLKLVRTSDDGMGIKHNWKHPPVQSTVPSSSASNRQLLYFNSQDFHHFLVGNVD